VIGYSDLDVVVNTVNAGPHPLALYPFTNDRRPANDLMMRVMSGGVGDNGMRFMWPPYGKWVDRYLKYILK
jgi:coniferyl-aldehyde dehydrogenase